MELDIASQRHEGVSRPLPFLVRSFCSATRVQTFFLLLDPPKMSAEISRTSRPPLSVMQHVIPLQLLIYALVAYTPRSTALRLSAFGVIALMTFRALHHTTGEISQDYGMGCILSGQLVAVFAFIVLNYPPDDFRHEKDVQPPSEMPFLKRMWWALCVMHSVRGIGWNTHVSTFYLPGPDLCERTVSRPGTHPHDQPPRAPPFLSLGSFIVYFTAFY
jgi:hypothetical protein